MSRTTIHGRARAAMLCTAFATAIAGCYKSEGGSAVSDSVTPATATPATEANVVTFTASDFAFQGPDSIPAGLTALRLVNKGPEVHHMQIVKLNDGKTVMDFVNAIKAGGAPPAWATEVGGPNAPAPGSESNATQKLEPGAYAVVCFVDTPDHVPHLFKGMMRALTVTPSSSATAPEPTADVIVTLTDYDFTTSAPLTAGQRVFKVVNNAEQPHEIELMQFAPGKTHADFINWMKDFKGVPPARPIGGIAGLAKGRDGYFTADLAPGEYTFVCFLPDAKDGKPHLMHGMIKNVKVT